MRPKFQIGFLIGLLLFPAFLPAKTAELTPKQKALLFLNRLTFGPAPGDLERVEKMGTEAFLEEQLAPEKLNDSAVEKELAQYPTLTQTINSLLMEYPQPGVNILRPDLRDVVLSPAEQEMAYGRIHNMVVELSKAKLTRITESPRQLDEVMVDFWFNHFNVSFQKNEVQWFTTSYVRDVIRPNALGKFSDLLKAVARSPAMLVYLDNNDNYADPNFKPVAMAEGNGAGKPAMMMQPMPGQGLRLNENYGRELMELHTLGVDAGYTQKDVTECSRVFTGWAVAGIHPDSAPQPVRFEFKPWHHDNNPKTILGHTFEPNGEKEGDEVLEFLSRQPQTAHRIAFKLCQRFVSDDPPPSLVKKVAASFLDSDGDIKTVLRTLFLSPEFTDPKYYQEKVKTPLEFVASALRATGTHPKDWEPTLKTLEAMGEPLFECEAPTGYPQTADAWVSSASLLGRANYAAQLTGGINDQPSLPALFHRLLNDEVSAATQKALTQRAGDLGSGQLEALVLASPDFQRR
ncbi:MAG TPA: DUF1800 domain-containing protein [bacterium]|nr:DUF1800 domain-containing protein [bacterium]